MEKPSSEDRAVLEAHAESLKRVGRLAEASLRRLYRIARSKVASRAGTAPPSRAEPVRIASPSDAEQEEFLAKAKAEAVAGGSATTTDPSAAQSCDPSAATADGAAEGAAEGTIDVVTTLSLADVQQATADVCRALARLSADDALTIHVPMQRAHLVPTRVAGCARLLTTLHRVGRAIDRGRVDADVQASVPEEVAGLGAPTPPRTRSSSAATARVAATCDSSAGPPPRVRRRGSRLA